MFSKGFRRRHFSYLFKRLDYFTISSVDCQQLIWIFWKLISFSVFQKQFLATACLIYHCRKEKSSTFYKKLQILFLYDSQSTIYQGTSHSLERYVENHRMFIPHILLKLCHRTVNYPKTPALLYQTLAIVNSLFQSQFA